MFVVLEKSGKPGHGPTIRESITDGEEIPEAIRIKTIESKSTELWEYL